MQKCNHLSYLDVWAQFAVFFMHDVSKEKARVAWQQNAQTLKHELRSIYVYNIIAHIKFIAGAF